MGSSIRMAALAAVALCGYQSADAGFVYTSSNRVVDVSVNNAVVDSQSTTAQGSWYGSASSNTSSYAGLATQGSNLSFAAMTFVGAAQLDASATAAIAARSAASVFFSSNATESIRWIADLAAQAQGANNTSSIALSVFDITSNSTVLAFTGPSIGSGSFNVTSGHNYRVELAANASAAGPVNALANYNVGFFSTVPGPGAMALVGLAGLASRRRR